MNMGAAQSGFLQSLWRDISIVVAACHGDFGGGDEASDLYD